MHCRVLYRVKYSVQYSFEYSVQCAEAPGRLMSILEEVRVVTYGKELKNQNWKLGTLYFYVLKNT